MNGLTRYYSVLGLTPLDGINTIKSSYRQLQKKFHPDTFTGRGDEAQRVMCHLKEAMRMLSEEHARPFFEPKLLSKVSNFGDFENAEVNSKTPEYKKETDNLEDEAKIFIRYGIYSNNKGMEKTFKKFSEFNPELSQLKACLAKLFVP